MAVRMNGFINYIGAMNKCMIVLAVTIMAIGPHLLHAQNDKSNEPKPPVYNYVIDDPMDKFQPQQKAQTYSYLVPEFYFHTARKHKDTTFQFSCYNVHDSLLTSVIDYDSVFYYSLYKNYTDSTHTYVDSNGERQFIPVSSIVKRYDKVGKEKWMTIEYPGNKYGELRAFRHVITRTDTEKVLNAQGDHIYDRVFHHYKLIK
jgi:hypothetical protein